MTTKMISEETLQPQAQEETRITPRDLRRVFWRFPDGVLVEL
nr:Uncharacterised protein [Klebsiella pneumoniae]